jgi:hypothetical protein
MRRIIQKIRQSLPDHRSLKRYFTYALGEILLIMVGVLLAFQVGNWNENRKNKKTEIAYYKNIQRQLNDDKKIINFNLAYNNKYWGQFVFANQLIGENDRSKMDTLSKISLNLIRYSDFHRASNIYETIVNSGQIKLLQNQKIIEDLQRLEETYVYINKMESIHLDVIKQIVLPDLIVLMNFSEQTVENPDTLFTTAFQNRFSLLTDIIREKNEVYNRAIHEINQINELIDTEINY